MKHYDDDLLVLLARLRTRSSVMHYDDDPDPLGRSLIAGVKEGMQEPAAEITRSDREVEDE